MPKLRAVVMRDEIDRDVERLGVRLDSKGRRNMARVAGPVELVARLARRPSPGLIAQRHADFAVVLLQIRSTVGQCCELVCPPWLAAIRCPYHLWTYEFDGRLRGAPHLDPAEVAELSLTELPLETWGGFAFVRQAGNGPGLLDSLGAVTDRLANYPLGDLRNGHRITYEVAANWKVLSENYNECYHCGPVHPELCALVPSFRKGGGNDLDWADGIPHRDGAYTFTTSGTTTRQPFPGLNEAERVCRTGRSANGCSAA
jgi:Ring hydroxylating alpha subunit (catalytic domain)